jgi:hypothetical protein
LTTLGLTTTQDDVRKHTAFLLGTPGDGILEKKVAGDEADGYDPLQHEFPCTANNFKLHLEGTPAHPWNKAAAKVFVTSFCAKYPHHAANDAGSHFKVHVDSLIRKYRTQQLTKDDPIAKAEAKKKNRKKSRKATVSTSLLKRIFRTKPNCAQLFEDRKKTVYNVPELQKHAWIIDHLGPAGMSSDESSVERGVKVYRIKKKFWRAAELRPFLHAIDRVTEQTKNATTTKGSQKYHRLPGEGVSSEGGIAPGLPVNFYGAAWLDNLRAHMKPAYDLLEIDPNVYPLVHNQVIQE